MKFLLTSNGITNDSLASAVRKLAGDNIRIAFIPTAANVEVGDKDWLIENFVECQALGSVDIVDISALSKEQWLSRLQAATVLFVGGGDTVHLIEWMKKSGLDDELSQLLETRLYVGISAGSIAVCPRLATASDFIYYDSQREPIDGLALVDIYVAPHLNSEYFVRAREENFNLIAGKIPGKLYALDDTSAVQIIDGKVEVVSEGEWLEFN